MGIIFIFLFIIILSGMGFAVALLCSPELGWRLREGQHRANGIQPLDGPTPQTRLGDIVGASAFLLASTVILVVLIVFSRYLP